MKEYFFWHDPRKTGIRGEGFGHRTCRVKTIGWKWVRIQIGNGGRWHRIKRSVWNDITKQKRFRTVEEEQAHLDFCSTINDAGISWYKPCRGKRKLKRRRELEEELRQSSGAEEWKEAA